MTGMQRVDALIVRIDAELAANTADRDTHLDPTPADLVAARKLPPEAATWYQTHRKEATA
ncbi:MAG: hypothetical protein ACTHMS_23610 [Jatrophihabitans sp.]|uniref:hypothetical protein n=1 Tax=Jatrophihabitans sp. TaxID=1932789 RepID=UPI003F7EF402